MKSIFRSAFKLGQKNNPSLEDALRVIYHWNNKFNDLTFNDFASGVNEDIPGGSVETVANGDKWGLRLWNPSQSVIYRTDITLREEKDDKDNKRKTFFNIDQKVGHQGQVLAPLPSTPLKPKIVNNLIDDFGAVNGLNLATKPFHANFTNLKDLRDFIRLINHPERNTPLVFMSRYNEKQKGFTLRANPNGLADKLAGNAQVYLSGSKFQDNNVNSELAKFYGHRGYSSHDGAIRLFYPGKGNPPISNVYVEEVGGPVINSIFTDISRVSSALAFELTYDDIKLEALKTEAKNSGDDAALLELSLEENSQLSRDLETIQDENKDLKQEVYNLETRINHYESKDNSEAKSSENVPSFESVGDVVEYAQSPKLGNVEFAGKAESHAKKSPYRNPAEVFNVLSAINEFYSKGTDGAHPVDFFRNKGFEYKQSQSVTTKGKYKNEYQAIDKQGNNLELDKHITLGSTHDPAYCISIAWDEVDGKAIIGSMSQHQRNTLS